MDNRKIMRNKRNNQNNDNENVKKEKKPFNKKKYREKKYSNKYKVTQWEERRKKTVFKEFLKDLKGEEKEKFMLSKNRNLNGEENDDSNEAQKKPKRTWYSIRQQVLDKKKKRIEEIAKSKQEQQEALNEYKKKKMEIYKQLSKKTKKGQPLMKGRIELLLEKIKNNT